MKKIFLLLALFIVTLKASAELTPESMLRDSLPERWNYVSEFEQTLPSDDQWWKSFRDATLDSLINMAERNNYNAAIAVKRIGIARQAWNQAKAEYFPDLSLSAGWTKGQSSGVTASRHGKASGYDYFSVGIDMNWEIDVFGRITANAKASKAAYNVSRADYNATMVALVANVARAYINLRLYQQELIVANEHLASQSRVEKMTEDRFECGLASMLDVTQARISVATTRASIPALEALIESSIDNLALLTGNMPNRLHPLLDTTGDLPHLDDLLAVGVPADLLRRRPDIVEAEAEVAQYAAQLGVAKKDFLPTLTISGSIGTSAMNIGDLFSKESLTYSVSPGLSWTIFDGLARNYRTAEAKLQMESAIDNYNLTVLTAVQEVDNYTSQYVTSLQTVDLEQVVVDQCKKSLDLSIDLYKQGLNPFSDVADAQMSYLANMNNLLTARAKTLSTAISIYEALGGGF